MEDPTLQQQVPTATVSEGGGTGGTATPAQLDTPSSQGATGGPPPPPSPLSGCYLLIVIGEPHSPEHKEIILQRIAKGFLSWDSETSHVDLEKELQALTSQAPEGEEARNGERLIQYATENLVTEVLIHPQVNTLLQCIRNLLSSFTRHRHLIHAGYTFAGNGSWILQDGTFSLADLIDAFLEPEVQRVLRAYENCVTVDIHCSPEGDWTTERLAKESFARSCKVRVNPDDRLTAGSTPICNFINYINPFVRPASLEQLLEPSDVVGNIRFSHPTLYVFPGGQGDAALFGINGFNMLVDGGFARKACFWDFARHLDRLDAVLMTRLNNGTVNGLAAVLRRKKQTHVYPQIGHFFCNLQERRHATSPDGDKDRDALLVNLLDEGQEIVLNLRHLQLRPHACFRDGNHVEPINLYHKVGHGKLDMYVISPAKDSRDVKEFLSKWNANDSRLFASSSRGREFHFPLQNLVSICALLVWQPANPNDTITRILFPGSTPQHKIFEGVDKLRNIEFLKHPVCTARSISPSASTVGLTGRGSAGGKQRQVPTVIDKLLPGEGVKTPSHPVSNKQAPSAKTTATIPVAGGTPETKPQVKQQQPPATTTTAAAPTSAPVSTPPSKAALSQTKQKVDKLTSKAEPPKMKTETNKTVDAEKPSAKTEKATKTIVSETVKSKVEHRSKIESRTSVIKSRTDSKPPRSTERRQKASPSATASEKKSESAKSSPTTPKKSVDSKINGVISRTEAAKAAAPRTSSRTRPSPTATPAKSTKEANNRKVVESKYHSRASSSSRQVTTSRQETTVSKAERKPISRRPKPASPSKAATTATKPPSSPAKSSSAKSTPTPSVKSEKDGVVRKHKGEAEKIATDSSAVSTPSTVEPEIALKAKAQIEEAPPPVEEVKDKEVEEEVTQKVEAISLQKEVETQIVQEEEKEVITKELREEVPEKIDVESVKEVPEETKLEREKTEKKPEEVPTAELKKDQEERGEDEEEITEDKEPEMAIEETQEELQLATEREAEAVEEEVEEEEEEEVGVAIGEKKTLAEELELEAAKEREKAKAEDEEEEEDEYLIIEKEEVEQYMEDSLQEQESAESHIPDTKEEDEEQKHLRDEVESEKEKKEKDDEVRVNGYHEPGELEIEEEEEEEHIPSGKIELKAKEPAESEKEAIAVEEKEDVVVDVKEGKEEIVKEVSEEVIVEKEEIIPTEETKPEQKLTPATKEQIQEEVQEIITSAKEIVIKTKRESETKSEDVDEAIQKISKEITESEQKKEAEEQDEGKEASSISPEEKLDISSEKIREPTEEQEKAVDQRYPAEESQPDERFSTTVESAATTAPTLPEDERIPLDEIKEIVEEKYVKEETKEEKRQPPHSAPAAVAPSVVPPQVIVPVVGGLFDPQAIVHLQRDIVKTPDEVADLPVHEEVDPGTYESEDFGKQLQSPDMEVKDAEEQHLEKAEMKEKEELLKEGAKEQKDFAAPSLELQKDEMKKPQKVQEEVKEIPTDKAPIQAVAKTDALPQKEIIEDLTKVEIPSDERERKSPVPEEQMIKPSDTKEEIEKLEKGVKDSQEPKEFIEELQTKEEDTFIQQATVSATAMESSKEKTLKEEEIKKITEHFIEKEKILIEEIHVDDKKAVIKPEITPHIQEEIQIEKTEERIEEDEQAKGKFEEKKTDVQTEKPCESATVSTEKQKTEMEVVERKEPDEKEELYVPEESEKEKTESEKAFAVAEEDKMFKTEEQEEEKMDKEKKETEKEVLTQIEAVETEVEKMDKEKPVKEDISDEEESHKAFKEFKPQPLVQDTRDASEELESSLAHREIELNAEYQKEISLSKEGKKDEDKDIDEKDKPSDDKDAKEFDIPKPEEKYAVPKDFKEVIPEQQTEKVLGGEDTAPQPTPSPLSATYLEIIEKLQQDSKLTESTAAFEEEKVKEFTKEEVLEKTELKTEMMRDTEQKSEEPISPKGKVPTQELTDSTQVPITQMVPEILTKPSDKITETKELLSQEKLDEVKDQEAIKTAEKKDSEQLSDVKPLGDEKQPSDDVKESEEKAKTKDLTLPEGLRLTGEEKEDSYAEGSISPGEAYIDSGLEEEPVYVKMEAPELPEYVTVTPDSAPPSPQLLPKVQKTQEKDDKKLEGAEVTPSILEPKEVPYTEILKAEIPVPPPPTPMQKEPEDISASQITDLSEVKVLESLISTSKTAIAETETKLSMQVEEILTTPRKEKDVSKALEEVTMEHMESTEPKDDIPVPISEDAKQIEISKLTSSETAKDEAEVSIVAEDTITAVQETEFIQPTIPEKEDKPEKEKLEQVTVSEVETKRITSKETIAAVEATTVESLTTKSSIETISTVEHSTTNGILDYEDDETYEDDRKIIKEIKTTMQTSVSDVDAKDSDKIKQIHEFAVEEAGKDVKPITRVTEQEDETDTEDRKLIKTTISSTTAEKIVTGVVEKEIDDQTKEETTEEVEKDGKVTTRVMEHEDFETDAEGRKLIKTTTTTTTTERIVSGVDEEETDDKKRMEDHVHEEVRKAGEVHTTIKDHEDDETDVEDRKLIKTTTTTTTTTTKSIVTGIDGEEADDQRQVEEYVAEEAEKDGKISTTVTEHEDYEIDAEGRKLIKTTTTTTKRITTGFDGEETDDHTQVEEVEKDGKISTTVTEHEDGEIDVEGRKLIKTTTTTTTTTKSIVTGIDGEEADDQRQVERVAEEAEKDGKISTTVTEHKDDETDAESRKLITTTTTTTAKRTVSGINGEETDDHMQVEEHVAEEVEKDGKVSTTVTQHEDDETDAEGRKLIRTTTTTTTTTKSIVTGIDGERTDDHIQEDDHVAEEVERDAKVSTTVMQHEDDETDAEGRKLIQTITTTTTTKRIMTGFDGEEIDDHTQVEEHVAEQTEKDGVLISRVLVDEEDETDSEGRKLIKTTTTTTTTKKIVTGVDEEETDDQKRVEEHTTEEVGTDGKVITRVMEHDDDETDAEGRKLITTTTTTTTKRIVTGIDGEETDDHTQVEHVAEEVKKDGKVSTTVTEHEDDETDAEGRKLIRTTTTTTTTKRIVSGIDGEETDDHMQVEEHVAEEVEKDGKVSTTVTQHEDDETDAEGRKLIRTTTTTTTKSITTGFDGEEMDDHTQVEHVTEEVKKDGKLSTTVTEHEDDETDAEGRKLIRTTTTTTTTKRIVSGIDGEETDDQIQVEEDVAEQSKKDGTVISRVMVDEEDETDSEGRKLIKTTTTTTTKKIVTGVDEEETDDQKQWEEHTTEEVGKDGKIITKVIEHEDDETDPEGRKLIKTTTTTTTTTKKIVTGVDEEEADDQKRVAEHTTEEVGTDGKVTTRVMEHDDDETDAEGRKLIKTTTTTTTTKRIVTGIDGKEIDDHSDVDEPVAEEVDKDGKVSTTVTEHEDDETDAEGKKVVRTTITTTTTKRIVTGTDGEETDDQRQVEGHVAEEAEKDGKISTAVTEHEDDEKDAEGRKLMETTTTTTTTTKKIMAGVDEEEIYDQKRMEKHVPEEVQKDGEVRTTITDHEDDEIDAEGRKLVRTTTTTTTTKRIVTGIDGEEIDDHTQVEHVAEEVKKDGKVSTTVTEHEDDETDAEGRKLITTTTTTTTKRIVSGIDREETDDHMQVEEHVAEEVEKDGKVSTTVTQHEDGETDAEGRKLIRTTTTTTTTTKSIVTGIDGERTDDHIQEDDHVAEEVERDAKVSTTVMQHEDDETDAEGRKLIRTTTTTTTTKRIVSGIDGEETDDHMQVEEHVAEEVEKDGKVSTTVTQHEDDETDAEGRKLIRTTTTTTTTTKRMVTGVDGDEIDDHKLVKEHAGGETQEHSKLITRGMDHVDEEIDSEGRKIIKTVETTTTARRIVSGTDDHERIEQHTTEESEDVSSIDHDDEEVREVEGEKITKTVVTAVGSPTGSDIKGDEKVQVKAHTTQQVEEDHSIDHEDEELDADGKKIIKTTKTTRTTTRILTEFDTDDIDDDEQIEEHTTQEVGEDGRIIIRTIKTRKIVSVSQEEEESEDSDFEEEEYAESAVAEDGSESEKITKTLSSHGTPIKSKDEVAQRDGTPEDTVAKSTTTITTVSSVKDAMGVETVTTITTKEITLDDGSIVKTTTQDISCGKDEDLRPDSAGSGRPLDMLSLKSEESRPGSVDFSKPIEIIKMEDSRPASTDSNKPLDTLSLKLDDSRPGSADIIKPLDGLKLQDSRPASADFGQPLDILKLTDSRPASADISKPTDILKLTDSRPASADIDKSMTDFKMDDSRSGSSDSGKATEAARAEITSISISDQKVPERADSAAKKLGDSSLSTEAHTTAEEKLEASRPDSSDSGKPSEVLSKESGDSRPCSVDSNKSIDIIRVRQSKEFDDGEARILESRPCSTESAKTDTQEKKSESDSFDLTKAKGTVEVRDSISTTTEEKKTKAFAEVSSDSISASPDISKLVALTLEVVEGKLEGSRPSSADVSKSIGSSDSSKAELQCSKKAHMESETSKQAPKAEVSGSVDVTEALKMEDLRPEPVDSMKLEGSRPSSADISKGMKIAEDSTHEFAESTSTKPSDKSLEDGKLCIKTTEIEKSERSRPESADSIKSVDALSVKSEDSRPGSEMETHDAERIRMKVQKEEKVSTQVSKTSSYTVTKATSKLEESSASDDESGKHTSIATTHESHYSSAIDASQKEEAKIASEIDSVTAALTSSQSIQDHQAKQESDSASSQKSYSVTTTVVTTQRKDGHDIKTTTTTTTVTTEGDDKTQDQILSISKGSEVQEGSEMQLRREIAAVPREWEDGTRHHLYSDEEDEEEPGSPLSITSQMAHSPPSDFDFELGSKHKESHMQHFSSSSMTSSFYGTLPPEPLSSTSVMSSSFVADQEDQFDYRHKHSSKDVMTSSFYGSIEEDKTRRGTEDTVDFERAMREHRSARGEDLTTTSHLYESSSSSSGITKPITAINGQKGLTHDSYSDGIEKSSIIQKETIFHTVHDQGSPKFSNGQSETSATAHTIISSVTGSKGGVTTQVVTHHLSEGMPEPPHSFAGPGKSQEKKPHKEDPIKDWGEPLGLPAPAPPPPTTNNTTIGEVVAPKSGGTPKKEKKSMQMKKTMIMNENNKQKDGKSKRPESPVKQPGGGKGGVSNKDTARKSSGNPIYIDLTYVPHHGNSYYTSLEFFKKVRARYYVFSGTEPSREVYNALLEAKQTWEDKDLEVTIIPTYDTDTLGYWVAENEDALAKCKIDLSPSASRCTINLQDHETSCSAYRLEF